MRSTAMNPDKECYECEACHIRCISFESMTRHLVSDHDTNERIGYLKIRLFSPCFSPCRQVYPVERTGVEGIQLLN